MVGRRDEPDVQRGTFIAAQAADLFALDGSQDFRFDLKVHIVYLVEQDCAAVRLFKFSSLGGGRTGKGPAFIPEQFAFEQTIRQGSAVDADKRFLAPRAVPVDQFGCQFLAGTALSGNENGAVGAARKMYDLTSRIVELSPISRSHPVRSRSGFYSLAGG